MTETAPPRLSIVTTMYKSAPYLAEFHERMRREALKITPHYEMIFVNDGSPDDSLAVALTIRDKDPNVTVVDYSRNFGHQRAMLDGVSRAQGDLVFLIDCDLEEEPEYLVRFYERHKQGGCDVVFGMQEARKGNLFERVTGHLFYKVVNALAGLDMTENMITARLMSRRYVQSLVSHTEREVFMGGLWTITGYRQEPVSVVKHSKGSSTYTLAHKLSLFVTSITSFSERPLVYIFNIGLAIFAGSLLVTLWLLAAYFTGRTDVSGWTSILVSLYLLGGLIISFMGVIGIYLSRIFIEVKGRPSPIVRQLHEKRNQW